MSHIENKCCSLVFIPQDFLFFSKFFKHMDIINPLKHFWWRETPTTDIIFINGSYRLWHLRHYFIKQELFHSVIEV